MVKDTFSRIKPSVDFAPPPSLVIETLQVHFDGDQISQAEVAISGVIDSNYYLLVYATGSLGLGVMQPPVSSYRLIQATGNLILPLQFEFITGYSQKFSILEPGSKVFVKFVAVDSTTGAKFFISSLSTIVVQD